MFRAPSAHHQGSQLYQHELKYMSLYVGDRVVYYTVTYIAPTRSLPKYTLRSHLKCSNDSIKTCKNIRLLTVNYVANSCTPTGIYKTAIQ